MDSPSPAVPSNSVEFSFEVVRLTFRARSPILFPADSTANVLRGALGTTLDSGIFRPKRDGGPSGLIDAPRPFVLRARELDGRSIRQGHMFSFNVNVFDPGIAAPISEAFGKVFRSGVGPKQGRASLEEAERETITLDLSQNEPATAATVTFLTPTELKAGDVVVDSPEFWVLFARLRDRISNLRSFYGPGPLPLDFQECGERARRVSLLDFEAERIKIDRRSSRTGQVHPLGGFLGKAIYSGDIGEFVPFLRAGSHVGVGRQTVWGKGELEVEIRP